jgi:proteic killer suppression protein
VQVHFADGKLERLYADRKYTAKYGQNIVRAFRKVVGQLDTATSELDLYNSKALHYEKLKGDRSHQRSLRLNDQMRLIVEVVKGKGESEPVIIIVCIEDYH